MDDDAAGRTVIWVGGEHDIATKVELMVAMARAAQRDTDIVVDLSEVTFMDASTIGALVGSRNRLRSHAHSLAVRAPSPTARRVLELCGLGYLVDVSTLHPTGAAAALSTWVDVASIRPSRGADRELAETTVPSAELQFADARSGPAQTSVEAERAGP